MYILNSHGTVVLSTDPSREGQLEAGQPWFRGGLVGLYVSSPSMCCRSRGDDGARPAIDDAEGRANGVLVGRPNMDVLNAILADRTGLGQTGETYLVGADHSLVTPSWGTPHITGQEVRVNTVGAERASARRRAVQGCTTTMEACPWWAPIAGCRHLAWRCSPSGNRAKR